LDALSLTVKLPVTCPFTDGAKLTDILQLPPGASGAPQVFVCLKPAVVEIPATVRLALPVLLSVTVFAPLVVPTRCLPKLRLVGDTEPTATGVAVGVGVAVRVEVAVGVAVAVLVAVAAGVDVAVAVAVEVAVGVAVDVAVAVLVGVEVAVAVAMTVAVGVGVGVAVLIGVLVGVGLGEGGLPAPNAITLAE
jgi:hypothetical protein